ncbi:MAG: heparinase II/III family protein [bacterium]
MTAFEKFIESVLGIKLNREPFFLDAKGFYASLDPENTGIEGSLKAAKKRDYFKADGLLPDYYRERLTPRFLFSWDAREERLPLLRGRRESAGIVRRASEACRHCFELPGIGSVDLGTPINWNSTSEGATWAFGDRAQIERDIFSNDCRNPHYIGDIRLTWEINHHHHLVEMARAFWLTGDPRYAREAIFQIEDWIERNPVDQGVNWISLQAVSERALSWMTCLSMLLLSKSLAGDSFVRILQGLLLHCRYLAARLKEKEVFYGIPLVRPLALYYFSRLFPEFRESEGWNRTAVAALLKFSREVMAGDCVPRRSASVAAYSARCLLLALSLARIHVVELPPEFGRAAECLLESLMWLTRPDGKEEAVGEWCGCFDVNPPQLLALGSVLFGRGDFKAFSAGHEDLLIWLLGVDDYERHGKLAASFPRENVRCFEGAGLLVFRGSWENSSSWLLFLGGQVPPGGHSDALSLSFFEQGGPVLVDSGCHLCTGNRAAASYFHGGWGHNVVLIDGEDIKNLKEVKSSPLSPGRAFKNQEWGQGLYAEASFSGMSKDGREIRHRREIIFFPQKNALAIRDSIECGVDTEHRLDALFHLGVHTDILRRGDGSCKIKTPGGHVWLIPYFSTPFQCSVGSPEGVPPGVDSLLVRYSAAAKGAAVFHTFIIGSEERFFFDPPPAESVRELFDASMGTPESGEALPRR